MSISPAQSGSNISWRHRDSLFIRAILSKTIRLRCGLSKTAMGPPVNVHVISTSGIFLLRIALARTTLRSGIAKRIICLPIFYPSLFKGICSVNSVMFSWAMPMCPLFVYQLRSRVRSVLSSTTGPYLGAPGNPTRDFLVRVWVRPRPHIRVELDRR